MRIALVSRELYPYIGGGIAPIVAAAARQLSDIAEVTVVTSGEHRERHRELSAADDPRLLPDAVRVAFVEEPGPTGFGGFFSYMHAYSARVHDVLRELYRDRGPDLIEFCDYLAEGFVTIQAAQTRARWLRDTLVCVRLHTTAEFCAVLDGYVEHDFPARAIFEAERYSLRHADRLLWSGGDVLATYRRYYGADALAEAVEIPDAFLDGGEAAGDLVGGPGEGQPVRLLYLGRMERRKGVQNLIRGLLESDHDNWRLTLLGGDTDTAPLGTSMDQQLRMAAGDDERIEFAAPVARSEVSAVLRRHDLIVIPSLWECWPNVAREALEQNRPLLATPVGGLCKLVRDGRSGWLATGTDAASIATAIGERLDDPASITDLIAAGGPRSVFEELADPATLQTRYLGLIAGAGPRPAAALGEDAPLVTVVVPYHHMDELVEETLDSVRSQTYGNVETIVVNDGSLRPRDLTLMERLADEPGITVVTQANAGLGAARNLGVSQARGAYVLPLDADDLIEPTFIERCVEVLLAAPELAYVGTWTRYMKPDGERLTDDLAGYMPYGNWSSLVHDANVAGVCTCLFRRSVFDRGLRYSNELTSYEDWALFREMHRAGLHGAIVPERLFLYRVRDVSMMRSVGAPRLARLEGEIRARMLETGVRWTRDELAGEPLRGNASPQADPERDTHTELERTVDALRHANAQLAGSAGTRRGAAAASGQYRCMVELAEARERIAELEAELGALRADEEAVR